MKQTSTTQYDKRIQPVLIVWIGLAIFVYGLCIPARVQCEEQKVIPEWIMPQHYPPDGFDGYGRIDRISDKDVVIDDGFFKLARSVTYVTPTHNIGSRSDFKVGALIGYLKNSEHEIQSMWLIDKRNP